MAALSDSIERFIKELMDEDSLIELKRNELAQYFGCAPSQINYVLATRFSMDRGYLVESRRGGGGYVKVIKITTSETDTLGQLLERVGSSIDLESAVSIIRRLCEMRVITLNEARVIQAAVSCDGLPFGAKDAVRAIIFKNCLMQAFKNLRDRQTDLTEA